MRTSKISFLSRCRTLWNLSVFKCCLGLLPASASAMVYPGAYTQAAPEYLEIRILERSVQPSDDSSSTMTSISLKAEIVTVIRTATDRKPGETILIQYSRDPDRVAEESREQQEKAKQGWAGRQVLDNSPPPDVGKTLPAYLRFERMEGSYPVYGPGAYQYSFDAGL